MFLFSRILTIAPGRLPAAQGFIGDITAYVNEHSPFEVSAWNVLFGRPVGTVGWSIMVEDLAAYLDASAELNASTEYIEKVTAAGDIFTGPGEDSLREVIHTTGDVPENPTFVTSTMAVVAQDFSKALSWSVEMADLAQSSTGRATMLLRNVYGDFGGLQWLSGYPDSAAVAEATAAMSANPEYVKRLDDGAELFVPGAAQQGLLRRIV